MVQIKKRKTDRRTIYTINVIKEAFLKLVKEEGYAKLTVAKLCREAEITRSTFYLHYTSLNDVLNEVLDDALMLNQDSKISMTGDYTINYLKENESLIPACQRIGDNPTYQNLLMDPDLSEYIVGRIMLHEHDKVVPSIIKETNLSQDEAETIFKYMIHGSFAVNRAHHFVKDNSWYQDVKMLNKFVIAGYSALAKNKL